MLPIDHSPPSEVRDGTAFGALYLPIPSPMSGSHPILLEKRAPLGGRDESYAPESSSGTEEHEGRGSGGHEGRRHSE